MDWWVWIVIGLGLLVAEMVTPGIFFLFFGFGALLVGVASALAGGFPLWVELLAFSVTSVAALLLFRKTLVRLIHNLKKPDHPVDSLVGTLATPMADIAPGEVGKAELRGTSWSARNQDAMTLEKGRRCLVVQVDGLTLSIKGE
jgi:membrane protein implicated in regulation of membrane protease activity